MPTVTKSDALLDYLLVLFRGSSTLADLGSTINKPLAKTLILEGPPEGSVTDAVLVSVGALDDQAEQDNAVRFTQEWGSLGGGRRDEEIWIECIILAQNFSIANNVRTRVYALLDVIAELIRVNFMADGLVMHMEMQAGGYTPLWTGSGFQGRMAFTVHAEAQLT